MLGFSLVEGGGHGHPKKPLTIKTRVKLWWQSKNYIRQKQLYRNMIRKPLLFVKSLSLSTSIYNIIVELKALELMGTEGTSVVGMIGRPAARGIHNPLHKAQSRNAPNINATNCTITCYNALAIHNVLERILF